jgi:serine/threonine protein kinase
MSMNWEGQVVVAVNRWGASTSLRLGKRLGQLGAEGTVYRVVQSSPPPPPNVSDQWVVKIFHEDKRAQKIAKVQVMLDLDPEPGVQARRIAWPVAIVHHDGVPVGYAMPRVNGTELFDAANPRLRLELSANLDLFAFHWLSENLAKTISSLHARNIIVGDFKDTNALFNPQTLEVYLIDTDSFGITSSDPSRDFPADAVTPGWSPPEWRPGSRLGVEHDLFSIPVFYHWLMFAVHPFSGSAALRAKDGEETTTAAIGEGRWLYADGPTPNKVDPPLSVIGPALQNLFRRAFVAGHSNPGARPTALEWEEAFREARHDLKWCGKHPLHVFDGHSARCPWCYLRPERWATAQRAVSRTKGVALKELRDLTAGEALTRENLERAERRLAANPSFKKELPDVVQRLEQYRKHQAAIDSALDRLRDAEKDDIKLIEVAGRFTANPELERIARSTFALGKLLDRAVQLEGCLNRLQGDVRNAAPDRSGRFSLGGEKQLLDAFQREAGILERSDGLLSRFAGRRTEARERLEAARALTAALAGSGKIDHLRETLGAHGARLREIADADVNGATATARDLVHLSAVVGDDIKLIEAAHRFSNNPALERLARHSYGLGHLLDRAAQLEACLNRLTAAVDNAVPDGNGRFSLDGEKRLIAAFDREVTILDHSEGLLARFGSRRSAARDRLEAARLLATTLAGADAGGSPIDRLREILRAHASRLHEIADPVVNGAAGKVVLARRIIELNDNLDQPAASYSNLEAVSFWDQHIAATADAAQIVDLERAPGKISLRAAVEEARRSRKTIEAFEQLLRTVGPPSRSFPSRDRAVVAADPTAHVAPRERSLFENSVAGGALADAKRRVEAADQMERLAAHSNRDAADPALVEMWEENGERDLLALSKAAYDRINSALARMARFAKFRAVAMEHPPDDERLLAVLADLSPDGDLLGLQLDAGHTLQSRVEVANRRIGLRDAVAAAIREGAAGEPTLEGERRIADAWKAAETSRAEAPRLFDGFAVRSEKASLRAACHREVVVALNEAHGSRLNHIWQRYRPDLSDFGPISEQRPHIETLLSRYQNFLRLVDRAEAYGDDAELIALSEQFADSLTLKDASEPRGSLGNRSLNDAIAAARVRKSLRKRLDELAGLALDPFRVRLELARLADALRPDGGVEFLGDDELARELTEAVAAAAHIEALRTAITSDDFRAFLSLWNETWHPLLPGAAGLVAAAQTLAARAIDGVSIQQASMTRIGDNLVRLSWNWPFARRADRNKGESNGSELLTIALRGRRPPDTVGDADHVITVFRRSGSDTGSVDLLYEGDRASASLFLGCMIAGVPIHSDQPFHVAEPKRKLAYRFRAAGFRNPDDRLFIRSPHSFWTPRLRIVHLRSRRVVSTVDPQLVRAGMECAVDLSQLRAMSQDSAWLARAFQRFTGSPWLCYRLELDDPSDGDWIEIVHPGAIADSQLSFLWPEVAPLHAA